MEPQQLKTIDDLATLTADVRGWISQALNRDHADGALNAWRAQVEIQLGRQADDAWWADCLAQVVVCGEWSVHLATLSAFNHDAASAAVPVEADEQRLLDYLRGRLALLLPLGRTGPLGEILDRLQQFDFKPVSTRMLQLAPDDPVVHGYEHFLAGYDPRSRTQYGVYYTPRSVVRFLLESADETLRREFDLPLGLADDRSWRALRTARPGTSTPPPRWVDDPFLRILDPACGTGAFLVELLQLVYARLVDSWRAEGCPECELASRWASYVERHVMRRVIGFEAMPAPWAIAHIRLAALLAATGCWLQDDQRFRIYLANTLLDPNANALFDQRSSKASADATPNLTDAKLGEPVTLVIGNPPYAGISDNRDPWIRELLRGQCADDPSRRSYYHVDGQPLGEKKLWLADDYVKFLRYAQWRIDRAGCGIVAFVTNHGFLDNPTFRGVRHSLLQSFPQISVVDLHGNVKKHERRRGGVKDESVFPTEQGMAASLFCHPPTAADPSGAAEVRRGDLWGTAAEKQETLSSTTTARAAHVHLVPRSPDYVFVERDATHQSEYERGYRLPDIMPVSTTAVVTARDRLVVGFTESELLGRIEVLRDPSVTDEQIRELNFGKPRSPKYPPGDTRGWKLTAARRRLQNDHHWRDRATTCLYRPFDLRKIYWADWMVDWPRTEVMRHLAGGANLALIARRQMLAGHECSFFWVTDCIAVDGVIRSDNRGSESVFPLLLCDEADGGSPSRVNFDDQFVQSAARILPGRPMTEVCDANNKGGPCAWLGYIYAQFHSPNYRERYADLLRADFPRVFLTGHEPLWDELSQLGSRLLTIHLVQGAQGATLLNAIDEEQQTTNVRFVGITPSQVARGYPKFDEGGVWIDSDARFEGIREPVWSYRVGGHQVCRKWFKDRRGRQLAEADVAQYLHIVQAIEETLRIMPQIDRAIEKWGGWAKAFDQSGQRSSRM